MCSQSRILAGECISENQAAFGYSPFGKREAGVSNTAWPNNILVSGGESFSITGRLTHDFGWATLTSVTNYSENDFQEGLEGGRGTPSVRSEEHTSELQSLMRISYAVFCLKQTKKT